MLLFLKQALISTSMLDHFIIFVKLDEKNELIIKSRSLSNISSLKSEISLPLKFLSSFFFV